MKKKLLATAVGAALAAPMLAQADVTVYGIAQVEWANISYDSNTYTNFGNGGTGNTAWSFGTAGTNVMQANIPAGYARSMLVDNNQSRFGIKATEDLGGGFTGLAVVEFQLDLADGAAAAAATSAPISARQMHVGLGHKSAGTLLLGRAPTPYAASGAALDPFVGTTLEARNNYGMSGHRDGWGVLNAHGNYVDGVFFNSASWAGAYVNVYAGVSRDGAQYTCLAGTNCSNIGASGIRTQGDVSLVAGWKGNAGPVALNVFAGYNKNGATTDTVAAPAPEALKFGAQVTIAKAHTISMQYEMTERETWVTGDADEATYLFLGYAGKFGPVTAVAQFGQFKTGETGITFGYEGSYMAVGAIYNMSKTFRLFAGFRKTEVESTGLAWNNPIREDSVYTLGMRKDF